jgi:hypothetical protein
MRGMCWILVGVVSASMLSAWADGRGYEPRTVPVNAGVVMFNANDNLVRDVYTFYAMDRRTDLKPLGLSFRNPFAQAGTTRNQAAYWLVDVSRLNDNQLARYKILLISRTSWGGRDGMTAEIREKLRRFVDAGGVLWVDVPQGVQRLEEMGKLFFPEVAPVANTGAISIVNLNHPLLRGYYTLTPAEMASMGLRGRGFGGGALNISANRPVLQIVTAVNANTPVIAAATYGSGRIIVSAAGIAAAISAPLVSTRPGREGQAFELGMDSVPDLELKFAYNLVRWAGAGSSDAFNARRANAVADQYGAPLGIRWRDPNTQYTLANGTPVVYGGLVFVVSGNRLICYDAVPSRDLDGDGRADDGIPDYERGESFDTVWQANLGEQSSPPVVVETPRGLQVVVLVGTEVQGYWALPRDPQGRIPPTDDPPPSVWSIQLPPPAGTPPTTGDQQIPAPIVIDNTLLLVPAVLSLGAQTSAGFFAVSLTTDPPQIVTTVTSGGSQELWYQPRTGTVGNWLLPPVAGYVPNYGQGGGNDLVVYMGVQTDASQTGSTQADGIRAFWLGAKGEVLIPAIDNSGSYQGFLRSRITDTSASYYTNRGIVDPNNPLHPRVYRIDGSGEFTDITSQCRFVERARIQYDRYVDGEIYIIDYYIDWSVNDTQLMFRNHAVVQEYSSQGNAVPPQRLRGFTLAPNGVLYITTGTNETDPATASGNVIALQEQSRATQPQQARSGSKILWRWQSHGGYRQIVPGVENPITVAPSTVYREPNENFMQIIGSLLNFAHPFVDDPNAPPWRFWMNFTFRGAPIYYNGVVYAFAVGQVSLFGFSLPYTVIVALDAEPEQFIIDLGAPIATSGDIRLRQRDYGRSGSSSNSQIESVITYSLNSPSPDIKVDPESGQIRITSFGQTTSNQQTKLLDNVLSINQPVLVSIGTYNALIDPDINLGNWNNLRWYAVLLGQQLQANPVQVGDVLYLPVSTIRPRERFQGFDTRFGIIGLATDPYRLQPDLAQYKDQAATFPPFRRSRQDPPLRYQSIVRWPFIDDLTEAFEQNGDPREFLREFFRRYVSNFEEGSISPIAVGDGLLLTTLGGELRAYSRQSTIIADESRLLEVDTAGRVVWSTENTQLEFYTGSIVASKARYPITPNARVYRYSENELLIVEPERNRIAIIDRAGAEIRTITQFIPDRVPLRDNNGNITQIVNLRNESVAPNSNYIAGAPTNLRNPTDVTVWTEFVPADRNPYTNRQPLEYWIHYTITDAGNARVVDIVDRYQADPNTFTVGRPVEHPQLGAMLGVLYWMTPSQRLERNYRYVSAQRFEYWDGTQTRIGFATLVQNTAASAFEATGMGDTLDPRTPEAGMITLQLIVNGRDQTIYIRRMTLPDRRDVPILAPVAIDTAKRSASGEREAGLYLLVTTSTGVYELQVPTTGTVGDTLPVTWMLTNEAYTNAVRRRIGGNDLADDGNGNLLRPILFKPRQARYLPNRNVLIVNGYSGTTLVRSGNSVVEREFPGEVFELNGAHYTRGQGFENDSIVWSTLDRPALSGSSQLRKPSSADRGGF